MNYKKNKDKEEKKCEIFYLYFGILAISEEARFNKIILILLILYKKTKDPTKYRYIIFKYIKILKNTS